MADLPTNLQRLENNSDEILAITSDIADAIVAKGGTLPANAGLRSFADAIEDIPNTYTAEDEGKVVSSGELIPQTAMPTEITENGTVNTTLFNSVDVNIPDPILVEKTITSNGTYNASTDVDIVTLTNQIPPVTIPDSNGDNIVSLDVFGNEQHTGTPSPQNPVMPNGTGDKTANLLDESTLQNGYFDTTLYQYNSNDNYRCFSMPLSAGTYTIFVKSDSLIIRLLRVSSVSLGPNSVTLDNQAYTFTLSATETIYVSMRNSTTTNDFTGLTIMLNTGDRAIPYEPYGQYKIPISSADTTTPAYLGEVQTTRRIRKLVFEGTESFVSTSSGTSKYFRHYLTNYPSPTGVYNVICTHFENKTITSETTDVGVMTSVPSAGSAIYFRPPNVANMVVSDFKDWLAAQYAAGTPVTIWYVLATPTTGIVNEPLMKIGDYVDQLSLTDSQITIPTSQGENTISIDTVVQPSSINISYNRDIDGYSSVVANVPNTYVAGDEGKVVSSGALVAQTAMPAEITVNDTYDTTLYNSIVVNVPSAPTPTPPHVDVVRFIDYDGTILHTYTPEQFLALESMPSNPTHSGLTSQGWNWSLSDAKTYVTDNRNLDIGQMYITDDGKTRLYITLTEGRTSPVLQLYLNANSELDVDWGDGSTHTTFTSTAEAYKSERHEYATDGDYVISITVTTGSFVLQSSSTNLSSILWNGNDSTSSPDRAYNNAIKKIEIGNGVTKISNYAFCRCSSLLSITMPNAVTSIGTYAFQYCYSLTSVTIGNGVTSIGQYAFQTCYSLASITIPDSVTSIGNNVFQYCYSLSSITIPDSVTTIGTYAFASCYSLSSITIPDTVTSIESQVFYNCYSLTSIAIPDGVTSIGGNAFSGCSSLSSITIPDTVTSIGGNAFSNSHSLSSVTIPDGVTSIGNNAFSNCSYMSFIKFESTTPPTVSSSTAWSNVSTSTNILVPVGTLNAYKTATNYPNPSTYSYIGYGTYAVGEALPYQTTDPTIGLVWYASIDDWTTETNPITVGNGNEVYAKPVTL